MCNETLDEKIMMFTYTEMNTWWHNYGTYIQRVSTPHRCLGATVATTSLPPPPSTKTTTTTTTSIYPPQKQTRPLTTSIQRVARKPPGETMMTHPIHTSSCKYLISASMRKNMFILQSPKYQLTTRVLKVGLVIKWSRCVFSQQENRKGEKILWLSRTTRLIEGTNGQGISEERQTGTHATATTITTITTTYGTMVTKLHLGSMVRKWKHLVIGNKVFFFFYFWFHRPESPYASYNTIK